MLRSRIVAITLSLACFLPSALLAQAKKTPAEAKATFTVPDDLRLDQVLAEPFVKQPVSMNFDEQGRMWVVNYEQYPYPAGLKILSRDKYWRVVYDKVPVAPPNHVKGKDRITIHQDMDGDGVYDKHSVFVEGLNITSSAVRGRGGVWVLNPPYLLFYPTKDNADTPTGDPVVHLQGFGMEDCHSIVNSLRWGPDGWLYWAQGSTTTASVTRPGTKDVPIQTVGQHILRYHPEKKIYEVFAEGGGNAFGVEIDSQGRTFSGHNGGDTRGFHYVQGGYYRKGFEKHGVLSNPFAFGFFEAIQSPKVARFTHTFILNESNLLPAKYQGKLIAVAPLQSHLMLADVIPERSSIRTMDVGPFVSSSDPWFRPVDIKEGPDGVYVADFYEEKIAHLRHYEGQIDPESGRIYRLAAKDAKPTKFPNLYTVSTATLVDFLKSDNRWARQTALRVLGDRRDTTIVPRTVEHLTKAKGQFALELLWALNLSGGLTPENAKLALNHPEPGVRAWTVRLLADEKRLGPDLAKQVADLAERESIVTVRCQLASSARRLPAEEALAIAAGLLKHDEDAGDIHLPLLLWWAFETECTKSPQAVVEFFRDSSVWRHRLSEETILPRLMRRFASAGSRKDLAICTELFKVAPEKKHGLILLKGFEEAYKGRSSAGMPTDLLEEIAKLGGGSLTFALRQGKAEAVDKALSLIRDAKTPLLQRVELIDTFGEVKQPKAVPVLLDLFAAADAEPLKKSLLGALQAYKDDRIGAVVAAGYGKFDDELRETAETLLASRKEWSRQWLLAVDEGKLPAKAIPRALVRQLLLHDDDAITKLIKKHWGNVRGATTEEMKAEIDRVLLLVGSGGGDPLPGKKLFHVRCATCHTLHSQGGTVGPDLTPFKRDDLTNLLVHVVNPSAEIREGFENQLILTESGRTLTGIIVEKDAQVIVLRTADGQKVTLPKDEIELSRPAGMSLMPEGLLQGLSDGELRDLFAYLRTNQPLNYKK